MAPRRSAMSLVVLGAGAYFLSNSLGFVGTPASKARIERVPAHVSAEYLERQGPKDSDVPFSAAAATGPAGSVTYKKRPFGILRYQPGQGGNGAMAMEIIPKSRYPGDPQGQAFAAGVQSGWVVRTINGRDVTNAPFGQIMDLLDDEVADPRFSKSTQLALQAQGGRMAEAAEAPLEVTYGSIPGYNGNFAQMVQDGQDGFKTVSGGAPASTPMSSPSPPPSPPPYSPPVAAPATSSGGGGQYAVSDADIENFYREVTTGSGGDPPKGTVVAELIVKFFHGEFTPQGFKRYSGLWKGPPPGAIGKKDIAVGMESFKAQMRNPMFVSKGGVGYGVDESQKVADDGKGWVWLAAEMSPGGLAVEMFTSVPYGKRALLVARRNNVDELFQKVNWDVALANIDKTLGGPQVKQR